MKRKQRSASNFLWFEEIEKRGAEEIQEESKKNNEKMGKGIEQTPDSRPR